MSKPLEFFEQESRRLEEEHKKNLEDKGYLPFWSAPNGTSTITILPEIPRDMAQYGRKAFTIINQEGEQNVWTVNPRSPQYVFLIRTLRDGMPHKVSVTRIGEKLGTRYELVLLKDVVKAYSYPDLLDGKKEIK
jgi:hypothetical protein